MDNQLYIIYFDVFDMYFQFLICFKINGYKLKIKKIGKTCGRMHPIPTNDKQ